MVARKDGDLVFITDNHILVDNIRPTRTIFCIQRTAEKIDVGEEDLIRANIASFGDDIGRTTNWITSMFDVQAKYEVGSPEYEILDYRIKCGELYQQNAIDKAKGIVSKPMPRSWYDYRAAKACDEARDADMEGGNLSVRIVADKKPYFMRYIYPTLMSEYNSYIKNTNIKCIREFRIELDQLLVIPRDERTDAQNTFLDYYYSRMPVGMNDCVMNRICKRFEAEFDGYIKKHASAEDFDYSILKDGSEYTMTQYRAIAKLYDKHNEMLREHMMARKRTRSTDDDSCERENIKRIFEEECAKVCSDSKQLCSIIVDLCYSRVGTQQFAWDVCGEEILDNIMQKNDYMIAYPVISEDGDITFAGRRFTMIKRRSRYARDYPE